MRLMAVFALLALLAFNGPQAAMAQKVYRISALVATDQFLPTFEGFKKKMAELGYIDGKNIQYDLHNARGDREALKALAKKMVQDKPSLIVTSSTTATVPVAKATEGTNLPVVFLSAGNPLRFAKSYSSSGNNLTGISTSTIDITGKRMELLKELAPGIRKVISLHNPKGANYEANLRATREAAEKLGFQLVEINIGSGDELVKRAKELLTRKLGDGVILPPDALINAVTEEITPNMIAERLPSISPNIEDVRRGTLATYAADYFALGQQGAVLVDKILRGARPMDLPIEQPFRLRLVINLKTAKAIGLKIPKEILVRADEVID
jgi:putative ABC transport system substrate-binding protein